MSVAVFPPAGGAVNFALDEALAQRAAATQRRLVRVYGWSVPTVSFGLNEAATKRFRAAQFAAAGVDVVRRPTGGRALVHHRELTYSIAGPIAPGESPRALYDEIQQMLARALRVLGVDAEVARGARSRSSDDAACFAGPAPGELIVGTRKLAASAQWRHETAWLQHGSILLHDDQPMLSAGLAPGVAPAVMPAPATLVECLGRAPSRDELARAIIAALEAAGQAAEIVNASELSLDPNPFVVRYRDAGWTWRR
jgi:lipoate-protein ligase A